MSKESRKTPRDMLDRERTAPGREQCLLPCLLLCLLSLYLLLCQLVVVVVPVIVRLPACCGAAGGALVGVPPARPCGVIACYNLTVLNSSHLCVVCYSPCHVCDQAQPRCPHLTHLGVPRLFACRWPPSWPPWRVWRSRRIPQRWRWLRRRWLWRRWLR